MATELLHAVAKNPSLIVYFVSVTDRCDGPARCDKSASVCRAL